MEKKIDAFSIHPPWTIRCITTAAAVLCCCYCLWTMLQKATKKKTIEHRRQHRSVRCHQNRLIAFRSMIFSLPRLTRSPGAKLGGGRHPNHCFTAIAEKHNCNSDARRSYHFSIGCYPNIPIPYTPMNSQVFWCSASSALVASHMQAVTVGGL